MLNKSKMGIHKKLFTLKSKLGKISKDSTNPFFKSKFFDINGLLENVEPLMNENDLLLLQPIENNKVVTRIFDIETSEFVESSIDLPIGVKPQDMGSAITYYRRYSLQSLLASQAEDDDGNKASKKPKEPIEKPFTDQDIKVIKGKIIACANLEDLTKLYNSDVKIKTNKELVDAVKDRNRSLKEDQ